MAASSKDLIESLSRHPELHDPRVLEAIGRVPRDAFVPDNLRCHAWEDRALPISHDATISQPYVVAFMTTSAAVREGDKVLEVGTGSGYQAAVLEELGADVFSVENVGELAREASVRLERLGYGGVHVRHGDGREGWPEEAPFDSILVTAASLEIPEPLVTQLRLGGRLVIPLGTESQLLKVFVNETGGLVAEAQVPVRFVRLGFEKR